MPQTIRLEGPAMGTWFEANLVGDDSEAKRPRGHEELVV
jgi:hypothetical protein